eukprot:CAMPEP_0182498504 /NCGR_PEP_ID=MMETSP1321-20130603/6682_1 /TAXON_ID=91990 /ORGANISM="Bolidomonas sp., Strain RCC1657" /LENGTH=107 /DNA_ID=CAMNT_0024702567 /DNA_START=12 /DNA_END=331 /DNA_ORIENTATION=-
MTPSMPPPGLAPLALLMPTLLGLLLLELALVGGVGAMTPVPGLLPPPPMGMGRPPYIRSMLAALQVQVLALPPELVDFLGQGDVLSDESCVVCVVQVDVLTKEINEL